MATILHVDDEPPGGRLLEDTLARAGHHFLGAATVDEALQVLSREQVDLIISEYSLPGLTGLEFLSLLQRDGYHTPVIILTGHGSIEHAVAAFKAGAVDYVTKPVTSQQLEVAVEQALEFRHPRRTREALPRAATQSRSERQNVGDGAAAMTSTSQPPNAIVLSSLNIDEAEAVLIRRALEAANGNRTRTAQLLGISVRTLRNKLNGPGRIEISRRAS